MEKPYDSNFVMAFKNAFSSIPKMLGNFWPFVYFSLFEFKYKDVRPLENCDICKRQLTKCFLGDDSAFLFQYNTL